MANVTYTKGLVGKEDINWHDPSTDGTTDLTYSRDGQTGTVNPTKPNASHLAILSPPLVSAAQRPFAKDLSSANHTVEKAIENLRRTTPYLQNFEAWGGQAGDTSSAVASKNAEVLEHIIDNVIGSTGNLGGVFFPAGTFSFTDHDSDGYISHISSKSNIRFYGVGPASQLQKISGNDGKDFFRLDDCSRIDFALLRIDNADTTGGGTLRFRAVAADQSYIRVQFCEFLNMFHGVWLEGTTDTESIGNYWVENCIFLDAGDNFVHAENTSGAHLIGNRCSQSVAIGTGFHLETGSGANTRLNHSHEIIGNVFQGSAAASDITIQNQATFSSTNMTDITVASNKIARGSIVFIGADQIKCSLNHLSNGTITWVDSSTMVTARNLWITQNTCIGSEVNVAATIVPLVGFWFVGNSVRDASNGLSTFSSLTVSRNWEVAYNIFENCSTGGPGIGVAVDFDASTSTGGIKYMKIHDNLFEGDSTNKHQYSINIGNGGGGSGTDWVRTHNNMHVNYTTATAPINFVTTGGANANSGSHQEYRVDNGDVQA